MMGTLHLGAISDLVGAAYAGAPLAVAGAAIDSRRVEPGDLFVATRGERVDGHDFIEAAAERGAVAALTERPVPASIPCLLVPDSLAALTALARANRDAFAGTVVAITGSCGKTSVKNLCRAIFSRAGQTVATAGNYNNEIGVPLTLARLGDASTFAVVEMGATGRGDVAHLCDLARPQVSTVLNAMEAHLDGFGSVEDVASIKAEIFEGLGTSGTAVLAADSPWAALWRERMERAGASIIAWSANDSAEVYATQVRDQGLDGLRFVLHVRSEAVPVDLPLPGRHNLANALAAAALATAAGVPLKAIVRGLGEAQGEAGRLQPEALADGTVLIDDSYNANPGSVRAAIDFLAQRGGPRALVLGEMLELGSASAALHAEMGERAAAGGLESLIGVGAALKPATDAFGAAGAWYADRDALRPALAALLECHDTILVKGSRGAAMEGVIADLRAASREAMPC